MRVRALSPLCRHGSQLLTGENRIVEYATREQAQQAVAQLSNQNLMGRLVYVREVISTFSPHGPQLLSDTWQDREAEPRFIGGAGANRGGFGGVGAAGMPGGFNPAFGGAGAGGGRQLYVANVSPPGICPILAGRGLALTSGSIASLQRRLARLEGSFPTGR